MTSTVTPPGPTRANVGAPVHRLDGPAKAQGTATYAAEYSHGELTYAAIVCATVSRGRTTAIDTTAAAAVPGVVTVLTHENAPAVRPAGRPALGDMLLPQHAVSVDCLQTDEVYWDGQPVAVVVAEDQETADHAAMLVDVTYEVLPAAVDFAAEQHAARPARLPPTMRNRHRVGDADTALAGSAIAVDHTYTTPPYNQNALEPHATTAVWNGDQLTVYDSTQIIDGLRRYLARVFGVAEAGVQVVARYVGGGFGGKSKVWPGTVLAVLAARAVGRPVRLALDREAVYRTVGGRTPSTQRVAVGAAEDGTLTALVHTSVTRVGRAGGFFELTTEPSEYLYAAPTMRLELNTVELDLVPNASQRAPGTSIGMFALESAMDELAGALGVDPIELRMRNEPEVSPAGGKRFSRRMLREAFTLGAERFGWSRRVPEPGSMREGRWLVGMGVASAYRRSSVLSANVTVRLTAEGTVVVRCGVQEIGTGTATVVAQVAADLFGVPVDAVQVEYGDSTLPAAPGAIGSMHTASAVDGLLRAGEKLRRSLDTLARRTRTTGAGFGAVLSDAGVPYLESSYGSGGRAGRAARGIRSLTRFVRDTRRMARGATGAHFCEVRVDPDTGEVRVDRWLGVYHVGTALNEKLVTSQLRGGVVMGIGMALTEETLVDPRTGRIMNPHLSDYHVPVHADIPDIDVHLLQDADPTMPLGMHGVGELSICGAAAAIANAVHHATGRRIRDLPVTPDKLL